MNINTCRLCRPNTTWAVQGPSQTRTPGVRFCLSHLSLFVLKHLIDARVEGRTRKHGGDGIRQIQHSLENGIHCLRVHKTWRVCFVGVSHQVLSKAPIVILKSDRRVYLGPLPGPLFGSDGTPLISIQCTDEWPDRSSTHYVNRNPCFLHSLDHTHMGASSAWGKTHGQDSQLDMIQLDMPMQYDQHNDLMRPEEVCGQKGPNEEWMTEDSDCTASPAIVCSPSSASSQHKSDAVSCQDSGQPREVAVPIRRFLKHLLV